MNARLLDADRAARQAGERAAAAAADAFRRAVAAEEALAAAEQGTAEAERRAAAAEARAVAAENALARRRTAEVPAEPADPHGPGGDTGHADLQRDRAQVDDRAGAGAGAAPEEIADDPVFAGDTRATLESASVDRFVRMDIRAERTTGRGTSGSV